MCTKIRIAGIDTDTLDLDKTFNCGQCFRWEKDRDGIWKGIVKGKEIRITEQDTGGSRKLVVYADKEEWKNEISTYLDLCSNYKLNIDESDKFAIKAEKVGRGIRILRQEPWEVLVSFIISQRNNIPKIKSTIKKLCKLVGSKEGNIDRFPEVEEILSVNDSALEEVGLGYRVEYVKNAAHMVYSGKIDLDKLADKNMYGTEEAIEKLKEIKGVGDKVANCVALFGFHRLDTFPVDIWISRVIEEKYDGILDSSQYGEMRGLMQQYMFYYIKQSRENYK